MINARAEKLASSRLWESMLESGRKQPIWFSRLEQEPFVFAGLYRPAAGDSEPDQCVIITVEPNELVEDVHDRMPAMIRPELMDDWLDGDVESALEALHPFPSTDMTARTVGKAVGSPRTEGPQLIEPVAADALTDDSEQSLF